MLPNHEYPIPQDEPLIGIIRSPTTSGSKGKGKFCCQQYACAHQDNAEWVVGWHFEHRWLLFQKEPQARVRARLGPRARAWVRKTYARPPGRESIRKPVTLLRLDINVTGGLFPLRRPIGEERERPKRIVGVCLTPSTILCLLRNAYVTGIMGRLKGKRPHSLGGLKSECQTTNSEGLPSAHSSHPVSATGLTIAFMVISRRCVA
jgi:hypothetical protein